MCVWGGGGSLFSIPFLEIELLVLIRSGSALKHIGQFQKQKKFVNQFLLTPLLQC